MNENIPIYRLSGQTIVHDFDTQEQMFRIDGVVVLPVGAEIELVNSNVSAKVVRVRLLAAPTIEHPVTVCIDVRIPKGSRTLKGVPR
jgi:hypothetical protein